MSKRKTNENKKDFLDDFISVCKADAKIKHRKDPEKYRSADEVEKGIRGFFDRLIESSEARKLER